MIQLQFPLFLKGDSVRKGRGVTLIEFVLMFALLGILATSASPLVTSNLQNINEQAERSVIGSIQTGIYLYGNESMVSGRTPIYPSTLDEAMAGSGSPQNPLFGQVLLSPVNRDWVKEGSLTYRGPTGQLYVYEPNQGILVGGGDETRDALVTSPFGSILDTLGNVVFFSSGAIVDQTTNLGYFPDYVAGTVDLTLMSGTEIQTHADGSATLTLPDGTEVTIADVNGAEVFYKASTEGSKDLSYVAVGRGQAHEWQSSFEVISQYSSYNPKTRTYSDSRSYESEGRYASGSLSTQQGFIHEMQWHDNEPTQVTSSYRPKSGGGYSGTTETSYDYSSDFTYASNRDQGETRQAYGMTSDTRGRSQNDYSYDSRSGNYESRYSGAQEYATHQDSLGEESRSRSDQFEYEGQYRHNQKTGDYDGSVRYRHQDGRDYTYEYRYDRKSKTYTQTHRDNKTGEESRHEFKN